MKVEQIPVGPIQANSYILWNDKMEGLIIDPGSEGVRINQFIKLNEIQPKAVLLTHAHFDHIGALEEVRNKWNIPVYLHQNEADWLCDPGKNGSTFFPDMDQPITAKKAEHLIKGEQQMKLRDFSFQIFETPGHSPGSVSFYFKESGIVFSGDTLFMGGIGRTDLPGGDHNVLLTSIHQKLLSLPEETVVASGHGLKTTVQEEMDTNPFLSGL
jgi:hydroxyacylglutathione hydrolase